MAKVSKRTVNRTLARIGRMAYRPLKAPILSKNTMKTRLLWAKAHETWTVEQWQKVKSECDAREKNDK